MQTDRRERKHFKTCLCRNCFTYVYVLNIYSEYFTGVSNIWYIHVKWVIWQIRVSLILFFNSFESGFSLKPRELFVLKLSATERSGVFMAVDRKPRVIQRVTPPPRAAARLIKGDTERRDQVHVRTILSRTCTNKQHMMQGQNTLESAKTHFPSSHYGTKRAWRKPQMGL